MSFLISAPIFILSFLVVISILVFFHELGHYSIARLFNVHVERFSVGFGKPIWRKKAKSGTEWVISRIPIGGYVKFLGDAGVASNPDQDHLDEIREDLIARGAGDDVKNCFHFKPLWQRALIVLAGPVANFILAIVFFAVVAMFMGKISYKSVVIEVHPNSAAAEAGLLPGDRILTLDGKDASEYEKLSGIVALSSGEELTAEIERNGQIISVPITPRRQMREDGIGGKNAIGTIGAILAGDGNVERSAYSPLGALGRGVEQCVNTITLTGAYMKRIFAGKEDGSAFGGPARIATMTGKSAVDIINLETTWTQKLRIMALQFLTLSAALSVGLGIANLMPIPALDGGHLLFYGYEAIAGHPLSEAKQEFGFRIGFAILMMAFVYLTINDISYVRSFFS